MNTQFAIALTLVLASCGIYVGNPDKPSPTPACTTAPMPQVSEATSLLVFTLQSDVDPCSVKGYIVGKQAAFPLQLAETGQFFIKSVPAGKHDVVVVGNELAATNDSARGLRLNDVELFAGVTGDVGQLNLLPLGTLSGKAERMDQTDHAGIDVYVPGTDYVAKTASDGSYTLTKVPVGVHNLYFDSAGYLRGRVEELSVQPLVVTNVSDVALLVDQGADGQVILNNGAAVSNSRTVTAAVAASDSAILMKLAETADFLEASWVPLQSTVSFTFSDVGKQRLYVKFADANGLESSPYWDEIKINLFPNETLSLVASSPKVYAPSYPTFQLQLSYGENASEMQFTVFSSEGNTELDWQEVVTDYELKLPPETATCGQIYLSVIFRDRDGFTSGNILSVPLEVVCYEKIVTSTKANSHTTVVTDGGIVVVGGSPNCLTTGERYDFASKTWSPIANAPQGIWNAQAVWTGSKVVVIGGYCDPDSLLIYDPALNSWTSEASPYDLPLELFSAVWTGNEIAVFGGRHGDVGFAYNPTTDTWRDIPYSPIEDGVYHEAFYDVISTGTEVVLVPKYTALPTCCTANVDVYAWNPTSNAWRRVGPNHEYAQTMYQSGEYHSHRPGFFANGLVHLITNAGLLTLDPSTGTWNSAGKLPETIASQYGGTVLHFGDHLYVHALGLIVPLNPFD